MFKVPSHSLQKENTGPYTSETYILDYVLQIMKQGVASKDLVDTQNAEHQFREQFGASSEGPRVTNKINRPFFPL